MRGYEAIIAMRKNGQAPQAVFVDDVGADVNWHRYSGTFPNVEIKEGERLEALDLRWSVGLEIHISMYSKTRADAVHDAFLKAKAKRIICCAFEKKTNIYGLPTPELIEIKITTDGALTWQQ